MITTQSVAFVSILALVFHGAESGQSGSRTGYEHVVDQELPKTSESSVSQHTAVSSNDTVSENELMKHIELFLEAFGVSLDQCSKYDSVGELATDLMFKLNGALIESLTEKHADLGKDIEHIHSQNKVIKEINSCLPPEHKDITRKLHMMNVKLLDAKMTQFQTCLNMQADVYEKEIVLSKLVEVLSSMKCSFGSSSSDSETGSETESDAESVNGSDTEVETVLDTESETGLDTESDSESSHESESGSGYGSDHELHQDGTHSGADSPVGSGRGQRNQGTQTEASDNESKHGSEDGSGREKHSKAGAGSEAEGSDHGRRFQQKRPAPIQVGNELDNSKVGSPVKGPGSGLPSPQNSPQAHGQGQAVGVHDVKAVGAHNIPRDHQVGSSPTPVKKDNNKSPTSQGSPRGKAGQADPAHAPNQTGHSPKNLPNGSPKLLSPKVESPRTPKSPGNNEQS